MVESYQEEQALLQAEPENASFAEVWGVFSDGLALLFEGDSQIGTKHYKCNRTCVFHTFDRVRVIKDSGTYVAEYPVGDPIFELTADSSQTADVASVVDNKAAGIANLQFYYATTGHLHVRTTASDKWVEFVAKGF